MLENGNRTFHRKKTTVVFFACTIILVLLFFRLVYLMIARADYYSAKAVELHERERSIKAARGRILDCNGEVIADNKAVCTISVIHSQINDPEGIIAALCNELDLSEEYVRKRVEKNSSIERIKSNVDKKTGDKIRELDLAGVKVDEDYKRYYPYGSLASKVLGFTGSDNQGIIGLEVIYEDYLEGKKGTILTVTDAKGIEIEEAGESRIEPISGGDLHISMDINIQSFATQLANQALETKEANSVSIIVMNAQNGEILAMVNVPEFDLNNPYELTGIDTASYSSEEKQNLLNAMWRNGCINDTYEPGSIFKIVTAAAGLESGVVTPESTFSCPGYIIVEDRKIRCHKVGGHGAEDFVKGTMNSCNPVFITVGLRVGAERFYGYFEQFGLLKKTGVDLPGEAGTIMHKVKDIGEVELATISFGQSFQVTPIQLLTTAASIVNGGRRITPHLGVEVTDGQGRLLEKLTYPVTNGIVSEETSAIMREILEKVVSEGGGKNGAIEGVRIGGKTATSETLPRGTGKYISSFLGFAPADNPQIIAIAIINHPKGTYYGGLIAAPIIRQLFENILPYLGIMDYNSDGNS
ncbi:MAG TPA: penicillin-binding transpeptidase domain-containing protein [Lachnospiraceae bacterium]|nr:penicillin-binding transpeptidase domain-containing protein [Lachnospiraceae bacterium]